MKKTKLTELLSIEYPIIMAPMFLVSNAAMCVEALKCNIAAAIPVMNFRKTADFIEAIQEVRRATSSGSMGANLIVNKSNLKWKEQLEACISAKLDFVITSLGNPKETIQKCHENGIKVLCDVTNLEYARKVENLGADGIIAVNSKAGGHAGNHSVDELIPLLKKEVSIPIVSAGGVATKEQLMNVLELGAEGASVGTIFIASSESGVSKEYKEALVNYGAKDIVLTTKISGVPLTVINTPYLQKIGNKRSLLERMMHWHPVLKKYLKLILAYRGMLFVKKAAFQATYKTIWCAGPSIEYIDKIQPVKDIIGKLLGKQKEE